MAKTVIRNSIFETNSSSVHTLVLRKEPSNRYLDENDRDKYMYNDRIEIFLGQFGWGYDILSGFSEKASYLATMIAEKYKWLEDKETDSFEYRPMNKIIEMTKEDHEWDDIVSAISSNFGIGSSDDIVLDCNYTDPGDFYIDHQSRYPSIYDFLEANGGYSLSDYLFNEDIAVEIDNDNDYDEYRMKQRNKEGFK